MRASDALIFCAVFALLAACSAQPEAQKAPVETPAPVEVPSLRDFGGIGGDFALVDQHGARFELQICAAKQPCSSSGTPTAPTSAQ